MPLRLRLNVLISMIMVSFILVLSIILIFASKQSIEEGVEAANKVTLQLLDSVIISSVQNPDWGDTHIVMQRFLEDLGYVRSNRISLYNLQGKLLYKSPESTYRKNTHPPKWFVKFLAPEPNINSRLIRFGRLIVETSPIGTIKEAWVEMSRLFYIAILGLIMINIFIYFLLGKWLEPIKPMLKAIESMGSGSLNIRLPKFELPEFNSISNNFNKMGDSLEAKVNENQRLASIAEQTADAIIMHDKNLKISFWNHSAETIFGYKRDEIIGKSAEIIVPSDLKKDFQKLLTIFKKEKSITNYETKRLTKDGKLIDVSISASPLIDPKTKKLIGDIVSMRDISERILAQKSRDELKQNRKLTTIIQGHIEDERRSLARELHDELGQYVSAIKIFAQNINNKSEGNKDIKMSASSVTSAANQIYDGMHNIIRKLRPGALDNLGLSETIKDAVSTWKKQHKNLKFSLKIVGEINDLGEAININIYRMIQEAMNNALKHSNANEITIKLNIIKNSLKLEFYDDGVGFDTKILKDSKQFGLIGIKERVQSLKGTFDLQTSPSNGARLIILIPIRQLKA